MADSTRPALITFVGILAYIKAGAGALMSLLFFVALASDDLGEALGTTETGGLIAAGVIELLFALFFLALAGGVMKGSPAARLWLTIVAGVRLAAIGVLMTGAIAGAYEHVTIGLLNIAIPLIMIYIMWGSEKGAAHFSR